jgi:D-alanyl-D-alanine carboxypeptidase (penicillin-binding protein 5/6)
MKTINDQDITAKAFLTLAITTGGYERILAGRNLEQALPMASITKLMTAIIVLKNIDLNTTVKATSDYVGGDGTNFFVEVGKTYTVEALLHNMLIPSDNDSARLLASILGTENFVSLMNKEAERLGLSHTHYVNVTGLDPLKGETGLNVSSVSNLAKIIIYINKNYPTIWDITRNGQYNFCSIDNVCKLVVSTDKFLNDPNFDYRIIGSKTGQTMLANKNLALILEPLDGIFLVNVVLGAEDNFADTRTIIDHLIINS